MEAMEFLQSYIRSGRRAYMLGDLKNGVIVALDVEGRIFAYKNGVVLNRINEEAITAISTRDRYINPGGDGFWPAPEGSCVGYEYSTPQWRVPPALTNARWLVTKQGLNCASFAAEVDLINAQGVGLPLRFTRDISIENSASTLKVKVTEGLEYLGTRELGPAQAVLAPWSLCQFDCGPDCVVRLPDVPETEFWDMYPWDSACHRTKTDKGFEVEMVTDFRFQLGMSPKVEWIEFEDKKRGFTVRRTAEMPAEGYRYIPIDDVAPTMPCANRPIRFSAYCDPSGFMEIEAAGGAPAKLVNGTKTELTVLTEYTVNA